MGKRSKRRQTNRNDNTDNDDPLTPSAIPETTTTTNTTSNKKKTPSTSIQDQIIDEETKDNLHFEDPFIDEYEDEEEHNTTNNNNDDQQEEPLNTSMETESTPSNTNTNTNTNPATIQSWNPLTSTPLTPGTKLEIDESAYKMHHSLTPDWPALSFDILRDTLGEGRTRFPHSMVIAVGSQADRADRNRLTLMKMGDLVRTGVGGNRGKSEKEMEDDIMGPEYTKEGDEDSDEEGEEEDEEEMNDLDPVLEHYNLKHAGGINRVRCMPQSPEIIATWSDQGIVNLYNVKGILENFQRSAVGAASSSLDAKRSTGGGAPTKIQRDPFFVYQGHETEGYAMDWSRVSRGHLATGDCNGHVHLWQPTESGVSTQTKYNSTSFRVSKAYGPSSDANIDTPSIEDIQWSPTEATVLAVAECGGYVKIYDTRCEGRAMLSQRIHENNADVNVISWNPIVSNLLASGGDDGAFSVWDLRNFQSNDKSSTPQPLARFTCHQRPITSLEWHPTDESMIIVTDEDGTYIYDLSIEEDDVEDNNGGNGGETTDDMGGIPPQLLFVHCGSQSTKEAHWHPQITSCVVTTALSGYSVFIPSNL